MKTCPNWPLVTLLVSRAVPLVVSINGTFSLGHIEGGNAGLLVARTSTWERRFESIGVPSAVLTTSCICVLLRNPGASSFSGGRAAARDTSKAMLPRVPRA